MFNIIGHSQFITTEQKQLLAISLLVSFSAAIMTELSRIFLKDIYNPNKKNMTINTQILKGNKIRNEQIKHNRSNCQLFPISALQTDQQFDLKLILQEMQFSGISKKEYKHRHTIAVNYSLPSYEKQESSNHIMVHPTARVCKYHRRAANVW
ncbi:MAG: hypothetical protein EZS28_011120 [Streblomastix strix]|uniref:Uncharacterized protein n=1 Tax=Streblomastix strix TaxID=222440 RepID=A0A5J4WFR5_9EUKA|nr:MAG: hypothetical protein EZS28_011120 [Streblomastix strix]